jgi:hypothetical protein
MSSLDVEKKATIKQKIFANVSNTEYFLNTPYARNKLLSETFLEKADKQIIAITKKGWKGVKLEIGKSFKLKITRRSG